MEETKMTKNVNESAHYPVYYEDFRSSPQLYALKKDITAEKFLSMTVEGIIESFCDVVNISMSNSPDSLSEYIDFYSYDEKGNIKNYLIDLRLSTHPATAASKKMQKKHAGRIDVNYELEHVTVKSETFNSYHEAIIY